MRRSTLVIVSFLVVLAAWGADECSCEKARRTHGWCRGCGVGYIAGLAIHSETLYEALDAHGHDVMVSKITCEVCAEAYLDGGFCDEHLQGFIDGQAYLSLLTWQIARGETLDPSRIECATCRKHTVEPGWCPEHALGMVGNVAIRDPEDWRQTADAFRVLRRAIDKVPECELCGASMAIDGRCPVHKIRYELGVGTPDR